MDGRRILDLISQHKTAAATMIIGLIAGPIVGVMLSDYISITPNRLVRLLENGEVEECHCCRWGGTNFIGCQPDRKMAN
jgi:hypothetical protein